MNYLKGVWLCLWSCGGSEELWVWTFMLLAELFNICPKESCFSDYWKVSSGIPLFKSVREKSLTKNYCPVSLLSVVSKIFEKLVNHSCWSSQKTSRLVCLFYDFQYSSTLGSSLKCNQFKSFLKILLWWMFIC